jgi:putative FmdB family regulatory protein
MPLYAYKCEVNDHEFEVRQKFADDALTECPECGEAVRRVIGGNVGIVFKGSGFYVTDNKGKKAATLGTNGSSSAESKSDGSSNGSDGGNAGISESPTKTETKAETKTESKATAKATEP